MQRFSTPAIVVRTVDYGEADRVVTLITRDLGKLSAIARAARKSTRRFGAGLGLFGVGEAELKERPGAELFELESFHGARGFPRLATDVAKVAHGGYACELARELVPLRQPEPEVFALLTGFLERLERGDALAERLRAFELRLLALVGLQPELDRCLACGTDALDGEGQAFDGARGGVVCAACRGDGLSAGRPLDGAARAALKQALARDLDEAPAMPPGVNAACREALAALINAHLGRPLKSVEFIAKLNQA